MKLAASMCSEPIVCSPPCSRSTPSIRRTFEPIPSICAPSETRKRQRSWTCGSQAALISSVVARGEDSRHHRVLGAHHARLVEEDPLAAQPVGAELEPPVDRDLGAELLEGVDVRVERPPADEVAAGRREQCMPEAGEQRAGEQERAADAVGELLVDLGLRDAGGVDAHLVLARPLGVGAEIGEQREHRVDVADARDVAEHDRLVGEQARGEDRERPVLVAGDPDGPVERAPPFDHERLHGSLSGNGCRQGAAILATALEPTRAQAWETLTAYTKSEALLRHALAVEASTASYARRFGEDEELWRVTALLHDFDYEIHPTLDKHPQDGAPILRELGYPEELIEAVLSHAEHLHIPRDTPLKKTLFACDELSGFVHACGLVRPTGLEGLEPKSVRKKLKQPSFAAGVHRDEVYAGAELLGIELDEHIANVVAALQPIAGELGLRTAADAA